MNYLVLIDATGTCLPVNPKNPGIRFWSVESAKKAISDYALTLGNAAKGAKFTIFAESEKVVSSVSITLSAPEPEDGGLRGEAGGTLPGG